MNILSVHMDPDHGNNPFAEVEATTFTGTGQPYPHSVLTLMFASERLNLSIHGSMPQLRALSDLIAKAVHNPNFELVTP